MRGSLQGVRSRVERLARHVRNGCTACRGTKRRRGCAGAIPIAALTTTSVPTGHRWRPVTSAVGPIRCITRSSAGSRTMRTAGRHWSGARSVVSGSREAGSLEDEMLRGLSHVRRRVEQLATQAGSGRCNGNHQRHRVVYVSGDDPTPPWPEADIGTWCACGAELEFLRIVHQHIPDERPDRQWSTRPVDGGESVDHTRGARVRAHIGGSIGHIPPAERRRRTLIYGRCGSPDAHQRSKARGLFCVVDALGAGFRSRSGRVDVHTTGDPERSPVDHFRSDSGLLCRNVTTA